MIDEAYIQFCWYWTIGVFVGYVSYVVISLVTQKINRLAFYAALVCLEVLLIELGRLLFIREGIFPPVYKPPLIWLVMNLPFGVFLYEIFFRKMVFTIYKKIWVTD